MEGKNSNTCTTCKTHLVWTVKCTNFHQSIPKLLAIYLSNQKLSICKGEECNMHSNSLRALHTIYIAITYLTDVLTTTNTKKHHYHFCVSIGVRLSDNDFKYITSEKANCFNHCTTISVKITLFEHAKFEWHIEVNSLFVETTISFTYVTITITISPALGSLEKQS